jgi:hypothetical protein
VNPNKSRIHQKVEKTLKSLQFRLMNNNRIGRESKYPRPFMATLIKPKPSRRKMPKIPLLTS